MSALINEERWTRDMSDRISRSRVEGGRAFMYSKNALSTYSKFLILSERVRLTASSLILPA